MRRTRLRRAATALVGAILLAAASACSASFGMPPRGTAQGEDTFTLWRVFLAAGAVVAAIVYGLIIWSVARYRRRRADTDDDVGRQFRANIPLELTYTAIPVIMIVVLFALTFRVEQRVDDVAGAPDLVLHTEAFDWGWRFTYEGRGVSVVSPPTGEGVGGPTIVLPVDQTVRVVLTSNDVIHAFWVPGFLFKRDAIPGRVTTFDLTPTTTGTFDGKCAEFCGLNHAYMTFAVRVTSGAEFASWLADHRASGAPA
jgi:cytochrome c oxidase subunit II